MDQSEALVFVAGHPPIRAKKIRFYAEAALLERSKVPPPVVPKINRNTLGEAVASLKSENAILRDSVSALQAKVDKLAGLKAFQAENVANGDPAEVPMTDEEITDPEGISFDRLALSGQKAQAKIKELNKAGQVGTRKGAADILAALGCDVAPAKAERKRNA